MLYITSKGNKKIYSRFRKIVSFWIRDGFSLNHLISLFCVGICEDTLGRHFWNEHVFGNALWVHLGKSALGTRFQFGRVFWKFKLGRHFENVIEELRRFLGTHFGNEIRGHRFWNDKYLKSVTFQHLPK